VSTHVERVAVIRARITRIDGAVAAIDRAEQQLREHTARAQPELDEATADHERATERLRAARAALPAGDVEGLGSAIRRSQLAGERADLQAELGDQLAPWAGL